MSSLIKTSFDVVRYDWVEYDLQHQRGSGYCKDQGTYQVLYKKYFLFGWCFLKCELDREIVPCHEVLQLACFGHSNWKSKFYKHIKPKDVVI